VSENEREQKLPKWAQEELERVRRERDAAINTLNKFVDEQDETPIWYEDAPLTGERRGTVTKRHYLDTSQVTVSWGKIDLDVLINSWDTNSWDTKMGTPKIRLSWSEAGTLSSDNIAMIPDSHNAVRLIHRDVMSAR